MDQVFLRWSVQMSNFILRTTHQEFYGINVGNHDWGYDNDEVDQSHGTHVAGIATVKKVGVHRGAENIYSWGGQSESDRCY